MANPPRTSTLWQQDFTDLSSCSVWSCDAGPEDATLPPVVLLPGLGMSSDYMLPLGERLARERTVRALDLPGFGRSLECRHARAWHLDDHVDALAEWAGFWPGGPVVWVGNSYGGQVALSLAARHPHLTAAVVALSPGVDPRARTVLQQMTRLGRDALIEPGKLRRNALRNVRRVGIKHLWPPMASSLRHDLMAEVGRIGCPALIVRGTRDAVVPERFASALAREIPMGRAVAIQRAGHAPHFTHVEEVGRAIEKFLSGVGREPAAAGDFV